MVIAALQTRGIHLCRWGRLPPGRDRTLATRVDLGQEAPGILPGDPGRR